MTIVIMLLAAVILMATMLFLTLGVNDLEKKTMELSGLITKRYTIKVVPKGAKAAASGPAQGKAPGKA